MAWWWADKSQIDGSGCYLGRGVRQASSCPRPQIRLRRDPEALRSGNHRKKCMGEHDLHHFADQSAVEKHHSCFDMPRIPDHELLRRIGNGSYGEVWLARNVFGEHRAVKIVARRNFNDERPFTREFEGVKRFEPISRSHPSQLAIL